MDPCIYSRSSKDLKNTLTFENRKFSQKRNFCILLSERVALSDLSLRYRVSMWNGAQDYNVTSVVPPTLQRYRNKAYNNLKRMSAFFWPLVHLF